MKIFLTGFMACGKSYLGRELSRVLSLNFIDLDKYIEEKEQLSVNEIFALYGEGKFRQLESRALYNIIKEKEEFILATGGGTILLPENRELMDLEGIRVFLDTPVDILNERLKKETVVRPLLKNISLDSLENYILKEMEKRFKYYNSAPIIVKHNADEEKLIENIIIELNKYQ